MVKKEKRPATLIGCGALHKRAGGDLLSHDRCRSTIGAEGLNFRVRDGTGCDPLARTTGTFSLYKKKEWGVSCPERLLGGRQPSHSLSWIKPLGRLVRLG